MLWLEGFILARIDSHSRSRRQGQRDKRRRQFARHSFQVVGARGINPGRHFLRNANQLNLHI